MQPIIAPSPNPAPCPIAATPHDAPGQPRTGLLRSGNPQGNPNLAPRCGAKTRAGHGCLGPAMKNGRCRMHGGASTGPRTPEGLARLAKARTTHGRYCAGLHRDSTNHCKTLARRMRVMAAAETCLAWLPADFAVALAMDNGPEALRAPPHFSNLPPPPPDKSPCALGRDARGRFAARPPRALSARAAEREVARTEARALAPWRVAIAGARVARRGDWLARHATPQAAKGVAREKAGQDPLRRGAVGAAAGLGGVAPGRSRGDGGMLAAAGWDWSRAVRVGGGSGGRAPADKNPMRPGDGGGPGRAGGAKDPLRPGAVRSAMGPFRRGLCGGTAVFAVPELGWRAGAAAGPDRQALREAVRRRAVAEETLLRARVAGGVSWAGVVGVGGGGRVMGVLFGGSAEGGWGRRD